MAAMATEGSPDTLAQTSQLAASTAESVGDGACIGDARLNLYEYFYLYEKIESNIIDSVRKKCISYLVEIIYKYGVYSEYEVRQAGFDGNLPKEVLSALGESNVAREWYLVKRRLLSKIKARLNLR